MIGLENPGSSRFGQKSTKLEYSEWQCSELPETVSTRLFGDQEYFSHKKFQFAMIDSLSVKIVPVCKGSSIEISLLCNLPASLVG